MTSAFFFIMIRWPLKTTLFPYTTLFRSDIRRRLATKMYDAFDRVWELSEQKGLDRKSTRLNSSHVSISYAVFCVKKKSLKIDASISDPDNKSKSTVLEIIQVMPQDVRLL